MATLSQLLALPDLGLTLVQAGPGDPELTWVSTSGLLNIGDYLEGGEIVLTTGLALEGDDQRWFDFAAGLSRARVAALGFGVGVKHDRIPAPLVTAASTFRLALFEVPPPVPFIAVSKAVAALLRADELHAAHRALQVHQRLVERSQDSLGPAEVLANIAQATGRQLAVLGPGGERLASTGGFEAAVRDAALGAEEVPLDESGRTRLAIAAGPALGPEERAVVAAGAMVLRLELSETRATDARELERWSRLADALLAERVTPETVTVFDPAAALPAEVRAVAVIGPAEEVAAWRRAPRVGLERLVTAGEPAEFAPGLAVAWQICPDDADAIDRAAVLAHGHGLDAVIGRPAPASRAGLSLRSARAHLRTRLGRDLLYAQPRVPNLTRVDRDAPLLEALLAEHADLASAVLGPLAARAPREVSARAAGEHGDPPPTATEHRLLRETLHVVLAHNGQRGPAAAELGVHRNTLQGRLARIERLTGRRIDDPDHRAELWLALRLDEIGAAEH